jgi:hypothetical protein
MFVWDTDGPACGGNNEWWGFRHDEHNSGVYGNDTRPPEPVLDLAFSGGQLSWTAPGEDHACGQSSLYELRRSTAPITPANFDNATAVAGVPAPAAVGTQQSIAVSPAIVGFHYAIRAVDEAGNPGPLSNIVFIGGLDDDGDGVFDDAEVACGGDPLDPAVRPERLDTAVDDDGDTQVNEPLPNGSSAFDCDGDGWIGAQEQLIFSGTNTARDQDPCGNNGWPSELVGNDNRLNIGDINSFLAPIRPDGSFNKFDQALDDDGDTIVDEAMARWNLQTPPQTPFSRIDIGDLNGLITGAVGSGALPPMFAGERAFFANGGLCPHAP